MAVGAWTFYDRFKEFMADGSVDLDTTPFRITLHTSASNAATTSLSTYASLTSEVTEANGYSSSGKNLSSITWTLASTATARWDSADPFWSASGGNIANIKFAVIWASGATAGARKLVCRSTLSTAQFTLTSANRLTIQMAADGIFELA